MSAAAGAPKLGECCPVLGLVLKRMADGIHGLHISTRVNFKTGDLSDALVVEFKRGKKGEEYRESTFAWARFCPFCGTPTEGPAALKEVGK